MRLLLIEDERTLCDAVARRLRRSGYSVDLAYDGERALQLLEVERYDLVLLDLNLPKLDGMSVLRTLRQTDRETRVLILSARSGTAIRWTASMQAPTTISQSPLRWPSWRRGSAA